jgi:hypothetical protein
MDKRLALSATVLGIALARPEFAYAGPFDMPPTEYAQSVNRKLQQEGSDLQFMLAGCTAPTRSECRFNSSHITVVVKGRKKPSRIDQVIIATDLLRDDPAAPPYEALADAFMTLAATMIVFDPALQPQQREALTTSLTDAVLSTGHGEGDGIDARYSATFDEGADGLLVLTVGRRR